MRVRNASEIPDFFSLPGYCKGEESVKINDLNKAIDTFKKLYNQLPVELKSCIPEGKFDIKDTKKMARHFADDATEHAVAWKIATTLRQKCKPITLKKYAIQWKCILAKNNIYFDSAMPYMDLCLESAVSHHLIFKTEKVKANYNEMVTVGVRTTWQDKSPQIMLSKKSMFMEQTLHPEEYLKREISYKIGVLLTRIFFRKTHVRLIEKHLQEIVEAGIITPSEQNMILNSIY